MPAWLNAMWNRRMLICIFTGFASGLPLYLLLNLVPAWLKTEGLSLAGHRRLRADPVSLYLEIPVGAVA
jgi:hypothetical protein